jgi:predicted Zn-dependent peptidase
VRDLILAEIEKVKKGEFDDWLVEAVINDFRKNEMRSMESNYSRGSNMVMAFTNNMEWKDFISKIDKMAAITKEDLVQFTKDHYQNNYGIIFKRTGEDPNKIRVEKPSITKVDVDRSTRSPFFEALTKNEVEEIAPVFVDYEKDLQKTVMKSDIPVLFKENTENDLFTLYYLLETGTNENPKMKLALDYLKYLGTENYSPEEFKKELYKLGADFNVSSSSEQTYVYLSGLNHTMEPALKLFEELLASPKADNEVLANMVSDAHRQRSDAKKNKNTILWSGLMNYARYGTENPFNNVLKNDELNTLSSDELISIIQSIPQMEHRVMYYGPMEESKVIKILNANHQVPDELTPIPAQKDYVINSTEDPSVYWTNYDMVQAEIIFQSRGPKYDKELAPEVQLYNEYFGGGMSGLVFQEIREAQGLAYSVFSSYSPASKKDKNDVLMAYIGTQADKQEEAMDALIDLINNMPKAEKNFENAKKSILKKIESDRVTKTALFFNYLNAEKKGHDYDIRKDVYSRVKDMSYSDLSAFHEKYVKDKKYNIALVGDKNKLNFVALSKYGAVQELSLDELFGYEENKTEHLN